MLEFRRGLHEAAARGVVTCPGEEQLAEYACGSLSASARTVVEDHSDRCPGCRRAISALAAALASVSSGEQPLDADDGAEVGPGTTIGRYVVLHAVGSGRSGAVYAAYDPELDRKIALKVLRARGETTRLAAEARALAKLSHPNVVAIHDVIQFGTRVVLAMELVEGETLRSWLATPHAWPEIRDVLLAAGRGLAAAHVAGVVHRDVKPENVLIGKRGRVQVCDFGFARAHDADLAWTGAVAGTPPYMAPEQLRGEHPQPASDQFSFAVTLYEATCGVRPFDDHRVLRAFTPRVAVPRAVRDAILRALDEDAGRRFPSLQDLLAHLEPPRSSRGLLALAGISATAVLATALALTWSEPAASSPCARAGDTPAWTFATRAAVHAHFVASARGAASTTAPLFLARVDDYVRRWRAARIDTCRATRERGEQSELMLDRRMACLAQRHDEIVALLEIYAHPLDAALVERAVPAARGLSSIEDCADANALLEAMPPPADPEVRAQISAARTQLARVRILRRTARYDEGLALASTQLARARGLGYAPLLAEAQFELGWLQEHERLDGDAERSIRDAIQSASVAHDDALVARAWIRLIRIGAVHREQFEQLDEWVAAARAAISRAGGSPALEGSLEDHHASALLKRADLRGARERFTRAKQLLEQAEDPALPLTLHNLGVTLVELGELDAGRVELERALAIWQETLGPDHPEVAEALGSLGRVHAQRGELDVAEEALRRSVRVLERAYGRSHLAVCSPLTNLANVALMRGDLGSARTHLDRVLAIQQAALGADHLDIAGSLSALGSVALVANDLTAARGHLERAIEIRSKVSRDSPDLIVPLTNLGSTVAALGDLPGGRRHIERALAIATQLGPRHPMVGMTSSRLGKLLAKQGNRAGARQQFERALAIVRPLYGPDSIDVKEIEQDLRGVR